MNKSLLKFYRHIKLIVREILFPFNGKIIYDKSQAAKWVFIIGCNNSGTTLLNQIFSRHPEISTMEGEGQFRTKEILDDRESGFGRLFTENVDLFYWNEKFTEVNEKKLHYDWYLHLRGNKQINVEKSPPHTLKMRFFNRIFKNAYFVILIRSPYGVCEGIKRKHPEKISIKRAALHWNKVHDILRQDLPHIQKKIVLTYDELTEQPHETLSGIRKFLDLKSGFEGATLGSFTIHGQKSPVANMDGKSISKLSKKEIDTINEICSINLEHFKLKKITGKPP